MRVVRLDLITDVNNVAYLPFSGAVSVGGNIDDAAVEPHVFHIENEGDYRDAFAYITAHEIDPEDAPRVKKILSPQKLAETAANDSGPEELFVRYRMKNLQPTVWMESRAIFIRGEQPGYACIIATDVTAQMEYQKEPLTGLLNRRTMEQNVEASLKTAKNGRNVTFLAIDVDSFKHVNDELGHEAGDRLLVQIADILREEFRRSDLISRMGGDEFAVFIPNGLPPKVLKQKVEHTLVRVQQISRQEHWEVPTGVSIGSCTAAGHEMTFAQLYRNADHAGALRRHKAAAPWALKFFLSERFRD